jgi:tetratricopeptide (TPR) repeat protein
VQNLGLAPLRQSLIEQLGRGASEGIVMMVVPESGGLGPAPQGPPGAEPSVQIHLAEASAPDVPGLVIRQKGQSEGAMTAAGAACLVDDRLDVASWGGDDPVADQIGPAQSGLTGEFDRADRDAVRRAVRFNLYLGFGAEARALIRAFATGDGDTSIWQSLARILDGEADGGSAFAGMAACDTAAALWAVLGDSGVLAADQTAKPAILRSFSALPAHLRRQLGPLLADRFLAGGDVAAATAVREAILRAPGTPGPGVDLMQARIDAAGGDHAAAEARLDDLASQSGPATPEALAALVEQRAALGQPVTQAQVDTLQEFLRERRGGPQEARFLRALVLAQGASGDFDAAFRGLEAAPDAAAILWQMLAQTGPDSALLAHAVLDAGVRPPDGAAPVAAVIADRLLTLGLADWAAPWLQRAGDPPAVLRARLALAQDDAQQALAILKAVDGSDAAPLRAEALQRQGAERAAAEIYAALGQPDKQWSALGRAHDWQRLASDGPLAWRAAAALLLAPVGAGPGPGDGPPEGPLARDAALVTQSAATRDAIGKLLATVKSPALLHD